MAIRAVIVKNVVKTWCAKAIAAWETSGANAIANKAQHAPFKMLTKILSTKGPANWPNASARKIAPRNLFATKNFADARWAWSVRRHQNALHLFQNVKTVYAGENVV